MERKANVQGWDAGSLRLWGVMTLVTSSAAILIRYCGIPASSIGFWRVTGAAVILLPWWIVSFVRIRPVRPVSAGSLLTGLFLGFHFASWAWAVQNTSVANAALFIAMQPVLTPLLGAWLNRDRLGRGEILGTILAVAGMLWIVGGQVLFTPDQIPGSLVALFSMVCCAVYFVLGRRYRTNEPVALFTVPVYLAAAAVQAIIAIVFTASIAVPREPGGILALAGLILGPTVAGHTISLFLLRRLKAHSVSLSVPVQFVLIMFLGMILFRETPRVWFYPGAALVLAGVVTAIIWSGRSPNSTLSGS